MLTYRIQSLSDLLQIPSDRLSVCLRDIEYAIQLYGLVCGSGGAPFGPVTWTDDGDHSVSLRLGSESLTLKVEVGKP